MEKAGFYHNLYNNVRYLRRLHGLTQKEMAAVLGGLGEIAARDRAWRAGTPLGYLHALPIVRPFRSVHGCGPLHPVGGDGHPGQ